MSDRLRGVVVCRHATQALPPEPHAAPQARAFLRERAEEWDLLPLLPDAQLAMTELVTNAVIHARTPLIASVSCADGVFELAVFDGNPVLPTVRPGQELAPHDRGAARTPTAGRGLLLVAALAAEWGISPDRNGKAVWARTPTPRGWPHADGCTCSTRKDAVTLASGRPVVDLS